MLTVQNTPNNKPYLTDITRTSHGHHTDIIPQSVPIAKRYRSDIEALSKTRRWFFLVVGMIIGMMTAFAQDTPTYQYFCLHNKDKGYMKQYKGIVGNDGTFRYSNAHDNDGSSIWVYSSSGYLQQEMYYLNVLNEQTLVLSTTPVTRWDLVDDDGKQRFKMQGSDKMLGLDNGNKPTLAENPAKKYAACTLTVTDNNKWEGPSDVSWTVQSPQLVTYLRTYYMRNITVKINRNDAGEEKQVVDGQDSRAHCSLIYDNTQTAPSGMGNNWNINTATGVIYNMTNSQKTVVARYILTPLDPLVLANHSASTETVTLKVNAKSLAPNVQKKYLLFNTQDNSYRFPKATSSLHEGQLLLVNGKQSDLTEAINGEISWDIEVDDEGYYSFKNVLTGRYFYYDAADFTVSNYGAVKIGSTDPGNDTRYKFRLYSGAGSRSPFGNCLYIIPYDKQFAVWKSDGVLAELYFALYMNTSGSTKIASIYKASDNAKWKLYKYEWQYRLWDDYSIIGDQEIYTAGDHTYTASTWFSRNIIESPANSDYCTQPGTKTHDGIEYVWELTGLGDYIEMHDELSSGVSTLTASVTLPPGTRSGTLKVTAKITNPASFSNHKTIPLTLYNLNPTLTEITSLSQITNVNGLYKLTVDNTYSTTNKPGVTTFSGVLDGNGHVISGLTKPLFETLANGMVRNLNFNNVAITSGDDVGAVCGTANGVTRIYNVGVLGGSLSGSGNVGGLVGLLDGEARVVNCFSYANITGGTDVGGIVGYNNFASVATDIRTMVMNCMFYGDITGGTTVSPVYGGANINNLQGGLNTFNYYAYDKLKTKTITSEKYNCALAVEEKYLNRFEFYRLLLNSNKKLAAFYATGSADNANQMAKWVLETADRTINDPKPYPVLKAQGTYPSIVNPDFDHAEQLTLVNGRPSETERNKGGKIGTLSVTISESNTTDGGQTKPNGASVSTTSLSLVRTDKDAGRFNFNYDKVQLPYYNDVGRGNYTGNRVVSGWKITAISELANDPYTSSNYPTTGVTDYPDHNYADRKSSNKDLYSVSKRVFAQGAYYDVPYGVTSITIEPYWAKAAYVSDPNYDVVYKNDYTGKQDVTQTGTQVGSGAMFNSQVIKTSVGDALSYISNTNSGLGGYGPTVYDNAVVLVGNLHLDGVPSGGTNPFTLMSVDEDNDHEPDYSLIYHHKGRTPVSPIRYDFLNVPGTAQAQKPNGASLVCNVTIYKTKGWFEITNTSSIYFTQYEYENLDGVTKVDAPLILQGGVIDQFVSTQSKDVTGKTIYIHLGGNLWIHEFGMGTHSDGSKATPHVPVSVTGGDYDGLYLTGTYNANAAVSDDNAECYISSGRFGEVAGAAQEQIGANSTNNGNVYWQIYDADIANFFGGGVNDAKPVKGNVTTDIFNSHVDLFCGGPKFGNMASDKLVTTTAEGCVFGQFFGAGYGGNSYSRKKYFDATSYNFIDLQKYYYNPGSTTAHENERGKYYNGSSTNAVNSQYGKKGPGVATDFDYEFFVWSSGATGARFFIKFVSFSLAQCNDVSSTLTGCTINENFYGGGSLGKVTGTATSVLDNCTIKGNAFGAGYSATLPKIPVRDAGFAQSGSDYLIPKFNSSSGMFEPGTFSGTTDFTWKHVDSYPSEGGAGFDGMQVITKQNIEKSNLGSVGEANLILKGNTSVGTLEGGNLVEGTGHVYGGGDESAVTGNTTVILQGAAHVLGNVYGGGNNGAVGGNSEVRIVNE